MPEGLKSTEKMSALRFISIAIAGMLIEGLVYILFDGLIILYAIALLIVGFPLFLKSRRATKPSLSVYSMIFTSSALFSVLGVVVAYLILREKGII